MTIKSFLAFILNKVTNNITKRGGNTQVVVYSSSSEKKATPLRKVCAFNLYY